MAYRLSQNAAKDVDNIVYNGAIEFGREQAVAYYERITRCCILLSDNPRAARLRSEVRPLVRAYPCGAHIIIYEIDDADDFLILRIHHSRKDWLDL